MKICSKCKKPINIGYETFEVTTLPDKTRVFNHYRCEVKNVETVTRTTPPRLRKFEL